jgi:hypothetical protein
VRAPRDAIAAGMCPARADTPRARVATRNRRKADAVPAEPCPAMRTRAPLHELTLVACSQHRLRRSRHGASTCCYPIEITSYSRRRADLGVGVTSTFCYVAIALDFESPFGTTIRSDATPDPA